MQSSPQVPPGHAAKFSATQMNICMLIKMIASAFLTKPGKVLPSV